MNLESIIIPSVTALIIGIILLFLEYRTSWFQKHFIHNVNKNSDDNMLEDNNDLGLIGASVTPIEQLDNRVGDWFQIAKEVKVLLDDLYCSDVLEHGAYVPSVEFVEINQIKDSLDREIVFDITTNFKVGTGYIRVQPSGRIVSCRYDAY